MKAGDLVKFHDRLGEAPMIAGAIAGRVYLVLRRDAQNMYKKYDDDSKWAAHGVHGHRTARVDAVRSGDSEGRDSISWRCCQVDVHRRKWVRAALRGHHSVPLRVGELVSCRGVGLTRMCNYC